MGHLVERDAKRSSASIDYQFGRTLAGFLGIIATLASFSATADPYVISWFGNSPEWNKRLGIAEIRFGCSSLPEQCMRALARAAQTQGVEALTLAINDEPGKIADYVAQYVVLSRTERRLRGIGLDDFISVLNRWKIALGDVAAANLLRRVVKNACDSSSNLLFGITLYEDELPSPLLEEPFMPSTVRRGIGKVSLYVHYRTDGVDYEGYARRVRELFPEATLVAGVYSYDRRVYLPCSQKSKIKCAEAQEHDLFQKTLIIQTRLLKDGVVDAIEFYPGNFGTEEQWQGWSKPNICSPQRHQECIDATKQMHEVTLQVLKSAGLVDET